MADPYSILGVARDADAADIKKAYRKLAKELHPDHNQDNPKAAERFSQATNAYDLLSDKDKRARFDRGEIDGDGNPAASFGFGGSGDGGHAGPWGQGGPGGGASVDFGDIFEGIFGGGRRVGAPFGSGFGRGRAGPLPRGENIAYRLAVDFASAATLAPQRITLSDGKTIDLKLPHGVDDGTQMKLGGKGRPGPGGAGDAIITIDIKSHPFFKRDGNNVRLDLPVTLDEAVGGAKIKVPTVDGDVILGVPAGSSSGKVLRLKGKGFTTKDGSRGDQLNTLVVDVPADDASLNAFIDRWRDHRHVRSALGV